MFGTMLTVMLFLVILVILVILMMTVGIRMMMLFLLMNVTMMMMMMMMMKTIMTMMTMLKKPRNGRCLFDVLFPLSHCRPNVPRVSLSKPFPSPISVFCCSLVAFICTDLFPLVASPSLVVAGSNDQVVVGLSGLTNANQMKAMPFAEARKEIVPFVILVGSGWLRLVPVGSGWIHLGGAHPTRSVVSFLAVWCSLERSTCLDGQIFFFSDLAFFCQWIRGQETFFFCDLPFRHIINPFGP